MTVEAQRRGDTVRRPNLAQTPLPDGRLARRVKQRSAAYASVPSRFGPPPGHALKSRPGSRPVYRPFERLAPLPPPYRSTPNTASPVRPVGGPMSLGRASSVGGAQRLAALHEHSLAWREAPRAAVLGGLWPHELATQQRPGSRPGCCERAQPPSFPPRRHPSWLDVLTPPRPRPGTPASCWP